MVMDELMIQAAVAAVLTFGVIFYMVPILIKLAYRLDLYDKPDGNRKLHTRYISPLGGVSIFIGIFLGFSLSGYAEILTGSTYLFAALVLLFFTGLKDDIAGLSANKKLMLQIVASLMVILGTGTSIHNFFGVFGIGGIPIYLSIPLTLFTMIVVMNAFNLIDGVDGLAGGIGLVASVLFGVGFAVAGQSILAVLSMVTAISLFGFLLYNFKPASIFMGDTGSLVVGFLLSFMAINFINLNPIPEFQVVFGAASPVLPIAFLIIPLYDTFTVFCKRALRGDSPFSPGRDHVHHHLLEMGFSVKQTVMLLYLYTMLISVVAIALSQLNNNIVLAVIVGMAAVLLPTNGIKRRVFSKFGLFNLDSFLSLSDESDDNNEVSDEIEERELENNVGAGSVTAKQRS